MILLVFWIFQNWNDAKSNWSISNETIELKTVHTENGNDITYLCSNSATHNYSIQSIPR